MVACDVEIAWRVVEIFEELLDEFFIDLGFGQFAVLEIRNSVNLEGSLDHLFLQDLAEFGHTDVVVSLAYVYFFLDIVFVDVDVELVLGQHLIKHPKNWVHLLFLRRRGRPILLMTEGLAHVLGEPFLHDVQDHFFADTGGGQFGP